MKIYDRVIKRIIDLIGATLMLIVTSPIMLITAIAIKVNDGGTVFYKQSRLTKDGKEFKIIKFRSMVMNAEDKTGVVFAKIDDDRITSVGKFIRKCRIDELPQMFNILKGDMCFVGPRPALYNQEDLVEEREKYHANDITPGLTGLAQVSNIGEVPIPLKASLDGKYVIKFNIWYDIKICLLTIVSLFKRLFSSN
mgnify:CR=1 FL=1